MNDPSLAFLRISGLVALLDAGEVSSEEVTRDQLSRIASIDPRLNAYIAVAAEPALAQAAGADRRRAAGERGQLLGVPLALKDLFAVAGLPLTAGSKLLGGAPSREDATVVRLLREAGAVFLGKTNMFEFAYNAPHPDFGETRNPWNPERTAGGSSGGSAAALAAGIAYGALGSDTGGSIRGPAAYCGVVGLKPTYGRVSRYGVIPLAWSLDHVGPLARTVRDTALLFDVIARHDLADPTSIPADPATTASRLDEPLVGVRVGIVPRLFEEYVEPEVRRLTLAAVDTLQQIGVAVEPVELPHLDAVASALLPIAQAEATSYHWPNLAAGRPGYGQRTLADLQLGATVLAKDYLAAQRVRRVIAGEVAAALTRVDALVSPAQARVAPPISEGQEETSYDAVTSQAKLVHTGLANLSGHPALVVPCGFTAEGLPVGLQLIGRWLGEGAILRLGHQLEQALAGEPEKA